MENTKEQIIKALKEANKDIPENVLTTGRLMIHLMEFRPDIPIKIIQNNNELTIGFIGTDPNDTEAWYDDIEIPRKANWYTICVMNK